jgi:hypothetical protein
LTNSFFSVAETANRFYGREILQSPLRQDDAAGFEEIAERSDL